MRIPWNKGLTKEDPRVLKYTQTRLEKPKKKNRLIYLNCRDCGIVMESGRKDKLRCEVCYRKNINFKSRIREVEQKDKRLNTYKKYRSTEKYRQYSKDRYHKLESNMRKARYYISNAVRAGRVVRPANCEGCGKPDLGEYRSYIEAHHYLGYDEKHWLTVRWLCTKCHKEAEK